MCGVVKIKLTFWKSFVSAWWSVRFYHCRHKLLSFVFRSHLSVTVVLSTLNLYVFQLNQATCLFFPHTCDSPSPVPTLLLILWSPFTTLFSQLRVRKKPFLNPHNFFLPAYNRMQDRKFKCLDYMLLEGKLQLPWHTHSQYHVRHWDSNVAAWLTLSRRQSMM